MASPSAPVPSSAAEPAAAPVRTDALRQRFGGPGRLKGRQADDAARAEVRAEVGALLGSEGLRRDHLIELLHRLNDRFGALFERHLVALAAEMRLSIAEVTEVASFYHHFRLLPDDAVAPRIMLRVCDGLSCTLAGAGALLQDLQAALGAGAGACADLQLLSAPCLGRCEQAPAVMLGQAPVLQASVAAVQARLVQAGGASPALPADDGDFDPAASAPCAITCGPGVEAPAYVGFAAYRRRGGYQLVAALVKGEHDATAALAAMTDAGLRGLGGAGFPAGRKWAIVRGMPGPRVLAVNLDEGEPGTFKDRTYLERDPHRFLEGALIAAQVVGTESVYLYLRDEYHACRALLQHELDRLQADPPCRLPRIELRRGAGAYVCGEESAMVESLEGRRGEPRLRPPYLAERGLHGLPTLVHNFETLYWVRDIIERGPAWFTGFGRRGRLGLRSFSVSGRVRQPGIKLAPAGITLRELVDEFCGGMADGHTLYAYLPGGASGGILPARLADLALDFDTLQPHGCFIGSAAVVVLGQHDRARDAALNAMKFFADESCGQCTPCRVGTDKAARLMAEPAWDHSTLDDLSQVMADASICGLGQAAPNVIRCVQQYFGDEVRAGA